MFKRLFVVAGALLALTACSPDQFQKWLEWNTQDPAAAQAWANNECGALCTDDWDQDGVVEPENPEPQAAASNSGSGGGGGGGGGGEQTGQGGDVWDQLAWCESGGNWSINTGNGYSGGLQFLHSAWRAYGGSGIAAEHSRSEQIAVAERILDDVGWGAWPACSRKLGLR